MSYYQSTGGANQNVGFMAHPQPYGGIQQQPQPYGAGYQNNSEYMTQITPGYPTAPPPVEYMRQPASYPNVPMMPAPEPIRETIREQPQVIIVHHNNNDDDCDCLGWCCRCICESVATLIWTAALIVAAIIVIGLIVYFVKFYRRHH